MKLINSTQSPATKADIGKKVLVFTENGAYEAIIRTVDELTGKIIEVIIKDQNQEDKIMSVKTRVVTLLIELPKWLKWLIDLFKK